MQSMTSQEVIESIRSCHTSFLIEEAWAELLFTSQSSAVPATLTPNTLSASQAAPDLKPHTPTNLPA